MPSGLWSGLVQGFGNSLKDSVDRQHAEKERAKNFLLQSAMYRLQNDENLTGEDQKEGFRQIMTQAGAKPDEKMLGTLFPDHQIETDRYRNPDIPPAANLKEMPQAPPALAGQQSQQQQAAPQTGGEVGQGQMMQEGQAAQPTILPPMPRNPLQQGPQVLGAGALGQSNSAPVVQQYTSGHGSNYDDLDLAMQIKQLEAKLAAPPRPRSSMSSLSLSRAQMAEMKGRRMEQDQLDRDMALNQYKNLNALKIQHEEQMREMALQPLMAKAKLGSIEAAMGRSLTGDEKGKLFGLGPSAQQEARTLDANDYKLAATQPDTPEGQAALARVRNKELENTSQLVEIQAKQAQIAALVAQTKDPLSNPKLLNQAKVQSEKSASVQWTITDQNQYLEDRTKYWESSFADMAATGNVANPELAQFAAAAKDNPMLKRKLAIELAQKDVQTYKQNLRDKIFTYGYPSGSQVITLHWLRRRAQLAAQQGADPNKIWDYWKQQSKDDKATILDDNLEIWNNQQ